MWVVTSYHLAALPEPVPVTAQSATPRSARCTSEGIDYRLAAGRGLKSLSSAKVRILRP
jgi:hypothetical protein